MSEDTTEYNLENTTVEDIASEPVQGPYMVTRNALMGALACWAVRQSPYAVPVDLQDALTGFNEQLVLPEMIMALNYGYYENTWALVQHLLEVFARVPEIEGWNNRRNGNDAPMSFTSRYDMPGDPDNDFVDLDALARNVAVMAINEDEGLPVPTTDKDYDHAVATMRRQVRSTAQDDSIEPANGTEAIEVVTPPLSDEELAAANAHDTKPTLTTFERTEDDNIQFTAYALPERQGEIFRVVIDSVKQMARLTIADDTSVKAKVDAIMEASIAKTEQGIVGPMVVAIYQQDDTSDWDVKQLPTHPEGYQPGEGEASLLIGSITDPNGYFFVFYFNLQEDAFFMTSPGAYFESIIPETLFQPDVFNRLTSVSSAVRVKQAEYLAEQTARQVTADAANDDTFTGDEPPAA